MSEAAEAQGDDFTIQIKLGGRSVMKRNTLIGASLGMMIFTASASWAEPPLVVAFVPLLAGIVAGAVVTGAALLGQIAARGSAPEGNRTLYWRAAWYAGLIAGECALFAAAVGMVAGNDFATAIFGTPVAALAGAVIAAALTFAIAGTARIIHAISPKPQLGEGQFDPLGSPERLYQNTRRDR
jgi:hypothetical protein